jgi:hypothetical protein
VSSVLRTVTRYARLLVLFAVNDISAAKGTQGTGVMGGVCTVITRYCVLSHCTASPEYCTVPALDPAGERAPEGSATIGRFAEEDERTCATGGGDT